MLFLEKGKNFLLSEFLEHGAYDSKKSGGMMILHFNLIGMFFFCVGLICWQLLLPYPLLGAVIGLGGVFIYLRRNLTSADWIYGLAFVMNVWYVSSSMGNVRQYDYYNFVMHADYFLQNGFFIDAPKMYLQSVYFQPPLWGLIIALATKFCMLFGVAQAEGFDCVRYLNLFAISGAGIILWRFMVVFGFKQYVRLGVLALFCFFPANSILANLVNNDAMVYFLMLAIMYGGYQWYLTGSWVEVLIIAGLLFVAGMIKFSGLMVVPALGVLGLCRFMSTENKRALSLWGQFVVIGLGAILGFGWGWFLLYFDFPLVPPPIDFGFQDLSNYSLADRLFSLSEIGVPLADIRAGGLDANVFLALLKTALFGEWGWNGMFWAYVLYVLGGALAVGFVVSFFSLLKYKLGKDYAFNLFAIILTFSVILAWVNFWLEYPYFCSSEFRYVAILLPLSLLWLGNYLSQKSLPKAVDYALAGSLVLFIVAKFMLYLHTI